MSEWTNTTIFSPAALQDIRFADANNFLISGGPVPTWRKMTMKDLGMTEERCSYCKSRHHETNCPNCGAPK